MLVLVQFPLVDLRSFMPGDTGRLVKPTFPIFDPPTGRGRDWFVRGAGAVRRRFSGDEDQLGSEDYYCDASSLIRFRGVPLAHHALHESGRLKSYVAFRRLFWDGRLDERTDGPAISAPLVGRVDIGFGFKGATRQSRPELDGDEVGQMLSGVLAEKVLGTWQPKPGPGVAAAGDELAFVGPAIAAAVLRASSAVKSRQLVLDNPWWVQAGRQSIIVEYNSNGDIRALPRRTRRLVLPQLWEESSLRVDFHLLSHHGAVIPVWFVGHSFEYHHRDVQARLRHCLTRMSAEIAALQVVGRMAADPAFQAVIDRPEAAYFRHFVQSSLQQIQADRRAGVAQMLATDLALSVLESAAPGEFANLRRVFDALDKRGQHLLDRFLNRVTATAGRDPVSYEYDFFLAHSSQDAQVTDALYQGLLARSATVFLDNRSLEPSVQWPDRLLGAQKASKVTIALISRNSIKSLWFKSECTTALNLLASGLPHTLVPVLLDTSEMPYGMNTVQGIALFKGVTVDAAIESLMRALSGVTAAAPASSA
ncbi:MAG: toll/interleukin-1 receptor domain-containing protein [Betaproteobacteria bacterium]